MRHGFSLVELAIVLVILGLITGGIIAGQSLIRAAEIRAISTEYATYLAAARTFQSQYKGLPGDINNATDFWGSAGGSGSIDDGCEAATGTGTQTCNGDYNGAINSENSGADEYSERFTFWQHLVNAGLLEGNYTGVSGSSNGFHSIADVNIPASKLSTAAWEINMLGDIRYRDGDSTLFDGHYGNRFLFGKLMPDSNPYGDVLLPEEAWSIDKKIDDGKPATGVVVPQDRIDCTVKADGSTITTSADDAGLSDAKYNLASTDVVCALNFRNPI